MPSTPFPVLRRRFLDAPLSLVGCVPGVFSVHKPSGMTSHDVVDVARRGLGLRRVGHGGTLDPMASGLLLILAGEAARLFDDLQRFDKTYRVVARLGVSTDTQDLTGAVLTQADPAAVAQVDWARVEAELQRFRGGILQTPPMFSAIKRGGKPLYELARQGVIVDRPPRPVTVHDLRLVRLEGGEVEMEMTVSSGFYVRSLVDDLGRALGVGAAMSALTRTRIGPFLLADAVPPERIRPASVSDGSGIGGA